MSRIYYFALALIIIDTDHTFSLECIYCPAHSTEDECKEMDMTQICINETKCGYARFIEERKDRGQLYPQDPQEISKQILSVTVKKGCMDDDYCTKLQQKRESSFNSVECIFCEEDLCTLKFPILCVECNEAEDTFCPIKTEPYVACPSGEVCFRQLIEAENYTQKRGCIDAARCKKEDLCEYCETDICWTNPIASPFQKKLEVVKENKTSRKAKRTSSNNSNIEKLNSPLIIIAVVNLYVLLISFYS